MILTKLPHQQQNKPQGVAVKMKMNHQALQMDKTAMIPN